MTIKKRWKWSGLFRLTGLILLIFLLARINLKESLHLLGQVDLRFYALSLLTIVVSLWISSLRWWLLLKHCRVKVGFNDTFRLQWIGATAGLVTPGQLGEFVKVLYHYAAGHSVRDSFLSLCLDRCADLAILFAFSLVGCLFLGVGVSPFVIWSGLALSVLGAGLGAWLLKRRTGVVGRVLDRMIPPGLRNKVRFEANWLTDRLNGFDGYQAGMILLTTFLVFTTLIFRIYLLTLALGLEVDFIYMWAAVPLIRIVGLLPVSIMGLGTREATIIWLFDRINLSQEAALALSILVLISSLKQMLVGLILWMRHPIGAGSFRWEGISNES